MVYPHPRGAAQTPTHHWLAVCGISPPAWGSPGVNQRSGVPLRYIPTRVGQPLKYFVIGFSIKVYPHPRGAATGWLYGRRVSPGISPPAWGSQKIMPFFRNHTGYIPTRVGQPQPAGVAGTNRKVYPHPRGAAPLGRRQAKCVQGISPPAWGSLKAEAEECIRQRYIPTRVGQPFGWFSCKCFSRVYPHPRGAAGNALHT